jgi:hypothetical protein
MNLVVPVLAVLGALMGLLAAVPALGKWRPRLARAAVGVGWLGIFVAAIGMYLGQMSGFSTLIGTAACAGLAVLPAGIKLGAAREFGLSTGAGGALVLAAAALAAPAEAGAAHQRLLLYAAHWGALGAALTCAIVASGLASGEGWQARERQTPGLSLCIVVAALCGAALIIGAMRGAAAGALWGLPLASEAGAVTWQIPPSARLPQGLWLPVAADLPVLVWLSAAAMATAVATTVLVHLDLGRRAVSAGFAACAALAVAAVATILGADAALPDPSTYRETALGLLGGVENASEMVDRGEFIVEGAVELQRAQVLPELVLLGLAGVIGLLSAVFTWRKAWPGDADPKARDVVFALHGRDYTLRAVILGWLAWLLAVLIHWNQFGVIGLGSPAEWTAVGTLLAATGLALMSWSRRESAFHAATRELTPGAVFALLVVALALAVAFNSPPGLSIVF